MVSKKDISAFRQYEQMLLMSLIEDRKAEVENKEKDATTNAIKSKAWAEITLAYNSDTGVTRRDVSQLKRCWDNLKMRYKAMRGKENRSRMLTGGGPADIDPPNALLDRVGAIVPFLDLVVHNDLDSTAVYCQSKKQEDSSTTREIVLVSSDEYQPKHWLTAYCPDPEAEGYVLPQGIPAEVQQFCLSSKERATPASHPSASTDLTSSSLHPTTTPSSNVVGKCKSRKRLREPSHESLSACVHTEADHRLARLDESALQQRELHALRLQAAQFNLEEAKAKKETAEFKKELARLEIEKCKLEMIKIQKDVHI